MYYFVRVGALLFKEPREMKTVYYYGYCFSVPDSTVSIYTTDSLAICASYQQENGFFVAQYLGNDIRRVSIGKPKVKVGNEDQSWMGTLKQLIANDRLKEITTINSRVRTKENLKYFKKHCWCKRFDNKTFEKLKRYFKQSKKDEV